MTLVEKIKSFPYTYIAYRIILFSKSEISTIKLAVSSKKKKGGLWFANNLFVPLAIIYFPYIITLASREFEKFTFTKTLAELSITGSLTLLGINVMRTSSTLINEKIDEDKIPDTFRKTVLEDIENIKSKLRLWVLVLSFIGFIFYFLQAGSFLDPNSENIIHFLIPIFCLCFFSIFVARLISVIQTNFFDNDNLIAKWVNELKSENQISYDDMKDKIASQGL